MEERGKTETGTAGQRRIVCRRKLLNTFSGCEQNKGMMLFVFEEMFTLPTSILYIKKILYASDKRYIDRGKCTVIFRKSTKSYVDSRVSRNIYCSSISIINVY